jgi:uncharacterized membrane protein
LGDTGGRASGPLLRASTRARRDYGIDDDSIKQVRTQVTEGTCPLFLMASEAVMDRVVEAMKDVKSEIIASNRSHERVQKLRDAFGQE